MNREVHVRFSEGLAVRFRGATQLLRIFWVGRVAGGWTPIYEPHLWLSPVRRSRKDSRPLFHFKLKHERSSKIRLHYSIIDWVDKSEPSLGWFRAETVAQSLGQGSLCDLEPRLWSRQCDEHP